eukprot:Skav202845  [mRNA]  locus=scaffold954:3431:9655:- [translate_table: standard]
MQETKALAALVPELYNRLFAVEEKMAAMAISSPRGPRWADTAPPAPRLPPDEEDIGVGMAGVISSNVDSPDDVAVVSIRWRRWSGHAMSEYSTVSRESLAERVCALDKSLSTSGIQVLLYENIGKYLKPEAQGYEVLFTGPVLCLVALVCWYLMVAKEAGHALALHRGIMATPVGPTRMDARENPFTCHVHYRLRAIPKRRKTYSAILLLYRLAIAVMLLFVGTYFLVYTVSVTELILNAVALGIILDIDDLLFDAMATTSGTRSKPT